MVTIKGFVHILIANFSAHILLFLSHQKIVFCANTKYLDHFQEVLLTCVYIAGWVDLFIALEISIKTLRY